MQASQIGEFAGILWHKLESGGKMNLEQLQNETGMDLPETFAAIGWLARENKISFTNEDGVTKVSLYQEHYY